MFVALENDIKPRAIALRDKVLETIEARLGREPGLLTPPSRHSDFNDTLQED